MDELGPAGATLFRLIADAAAILDVDRDGAILVGRANPSLATSLGLAPDQLLGRPLDEFYGTHAGRVLREQVSSALAHGEETNREAARDLPSGRYVYRSTVTPLSNRRLLLVEHDLSPERAAVHDFEDLQRLTATGVWSWNLVTDELYWSAEFRRIVGVGVDHVPLVEHGLLAVHPDDRERVCRAMGDVKETDETLEVLHRVLRPHGEQRRACGRLSRATDDRGRPVRIYGTLQDVTERFVLEAGEEARQRSARQQARALQLNDDVIQSLARAWLALDLGRHDEAWEAVAEAMATVRRIVGELLQATDGLQGDGHRSLQAGDLAHMRAHRVSTIGQEA